MENTAKTTHFGYQDVPEEQKSGMVGEVFDSVASRYDVMNDLMSGGLHHTWKDRLIDALRPTPSMHLLDVAGGTGDISFRFLKRGGGKVTICDINEAMLEEGKRRAIDKNIPSPACGGGLGWGKTADHENDASQNSPRKREEESRIAWQVADAEALPFADGSFDAYTISFGIRNVTHIDKALSEAYRVLKPGGHFLCLEFSQPENAAIRKIYDAYSFKIIPKIGAAVTGNEGAYRYLVESIRKFPKPLDFATMIKDAGFSNVTHPPLTFGVVALHSGWKI